MCSDDPRHNNVMPVRVLVVIGQLDIGGTELHLARTVPLIKQAGVEIDVFTLKGGGAVMQMLRDSGVRVFALDSRKPGAVGLLQAACYLRRVVADERPDIVHFYLPAAYLVGSAATYGQKVRRVLSRRSLAQYQRKYPGVQTLERLTHRTIDVALANSRAVASELEREGIPRAQIGIIYNGVDCRVQLPGRTAARQKLGIDAETFVLICIANLNPYKGHADLLQALAAAKFDLPPNWVVLFVGRDNGIGEDLKRTAEQAGIDGNLRWVGGCPDISGFLACADVGVLASHEEGFSNAILECMAAGVPMVVTDVGGNAEAIENAISGLVVAPRAPQELSAALLRLAGSAHLRAQLARRARERVRARFSLEQCAGLYVELYQNVLHGTAPVVPDTARM